MHTPLQRKVLRLPPQCDGQSWQPYVHSPFPGNTGNFIKATSCFKPNMVPFFQRVEPKCLAIQAKASVVSRSTVPTCVWSFSQEQARLSPCCPSTWSNISSTSSPPLPSLTNGELVSLGPSSYSPSCFCLWNSTGLVVLYFTYSLSCSSTGPPGHDPWWVEVVSLHLINV